MKILQINNHHELRGGSERVYLETGKLLAENGHDVFYFSSSKAGINYQNRNTCILKAESFENTSKIKKIYNVFRFVYSIKVASCLDEFIKEVRPDIAHLHIFYGQLSNSILPVLKKHKIPCVMSVHEYRMLCPTYTLYNQNGEICNLCASGRYINAIKNKCNKNNFWFSAISALECFLRDKLFFYGKYIAKFIMVSKFCKDTHERYIPGVRNKSIKLFNFIDTSCFSRTQTHKGYFLYFGRISREKGIATLLNAVKNTNCHLKVVGCGDMLDAIKNEFLECPRIEFCGFKSGPDLEEVIRGAKFVCVPSEWYENNPMTIIEAFAHGKPVIGANIGGIPELVLDDLTGFLFQPGDSVGLSKLLLKCDSLSENDYQRLSLNAFDFANKNTSKEVHYSKLMKIYNDILCVE